MSQTNNNFNLKMIVRYFGFIMVAVYLFIGFYLIISNTPVRYLNAIQKEGLGILLLVYGGFRGYRVYKAYREESTENL